MFVFTIPPFPFLLSQFFLDESRLCSLRLFQPMVGSGFCRTVFQEAPQWVRSYTSGICPTQ